MDQLIKIPKAMSAPATKVARVERPEQFWQPDLASGLTPAYSAPAEHPPRSPLVLRVGVVGHRPDPRKRPDPSVKALLEICDKLLVHIKDTFAGVAMAHGGFFTALPARQDGRPPSGLRLISALAEGADQWVASEAAQLGYELQAVLPFERAEYEKDFKDSHVLEEHRRLRGLATAVFELDGSRASAGESYLAAGRVLLNQTDLLFAIWDGRDEQGTGGTGQIVREALQRGIPTLWVNWQAPLDWKLLQPVWRLLKQSEDIKDDTKKLEKQVMELLLPPPSEHGGETHAGKDLREAYFAEGRPRWTLLGGWWNFFRDLLCVEPKPLTIRVPDFIPETLKDWRKNWGALERDGRPQHKLPDTITRWVEDNYLPHYAWANRLSVYYANHYRSSFTWIYLLGALAVLLALIGQTVEAPHGVELACIIVEMIVIFVIIFLTRHGRRRRWHQRWIDYRTLAERLRLARFNCLLGGYWRQANVPSHLATYGNPAGTWMHWHARAVERAAGLPNVVVDRAYLSACQGLLLKALISGQEGYHKDNVKRLETVDHRLHRFGVWLFGATLVACLVHFLVAVLPQQFGEAASALGRWMIFCAAFLPALGAAMAGIRSQGEFQRVVQRSRAMQDEFAQLRQGIANLPTRPNELNSQMLQQAIEHTTSLMYNEVLDWRIVFQDRPLVLPA